MTTLPVNGVPDDLTALLAELLHEARRLRDLGRRAAEVRKSILALNRNLPKPLPTYSAGGLAECVNCLLGGGGA